MDMVVGIRKPGGVEMSYLYPRVIVSYHEGKAKCADAWVTERDEECTEMDEELETDKNDVKPTTKRCFVERGIVAALG